MIYKLKTQHIKYFLRLFFGHRDLNTGGATNAPLAEKPYGIGNCEY